MEVHSAPKDTIGYTVEVFYVNSSLVPPTTIHVLDESYQESNLDISST